MTQASSRAELSAGEAASRVDAKTIFVILLGLYYVVLEPILRANRYFNDDIKRSLLGRTGWDSNGRPLTTLLMRALQCYDHAMVDISPFTQFAAIAVMSYVGVLIAKRFSLTSSLTAALTTFPLGAQPFFLENLSYKFDALSMAIAVLLAVLPALSLRRDKRAFWIGVGSLFLSLNFYQPAITIFLVFIVLEVGIDIVDRIAPIILLRRLLWRVVQTIVAMAIYQLIVGIHVNGWVKQKSASVRSVDELFHIPKNFFDFQHFVAASFDAHWWWYFGPVLLILAAVPIVSTIRYVNAMRTSHRVLPIAGVGIIGALLPVIALAAAVGPMLVLLDPPIVPRVFVGYGAIIVAALVLFYRVLLKSQASLIWQRVPAIMFAIGFCVIASAYGNAAAEQKAYEDGIATHLADDLANLRATRGITSFELEGTAGYAPVVLHVVEQFPLMKMLVPTYLSGDDDFHTYIYLSFFVQDMKDLREKPDMETAARLKEVTQVSASAETVARTSTYEIKVVGDTAAIFLTGTDVPRTSIDHEARD